MGCGRRVGGDDRPNLVPLRLLRDGGRAEVVVDLRRQGRGRGAWVHASWPCLQRAATHGLARSARARVTTTPEALAAQIRAQAKRRVDGLLASAWRARGLAVGGDAVADVLKERPGTLVVVAVDARAVARRPEITHANNKLQWGDKALLGTLTDRDGPLGVVAVVHPGIADALPVPVSLFGSAQGWLRQGGPVLDRPVLDRPVLDRPVPDRLGLVRDRLGLEDFDPNFENAGEPSVVAG
ncbi:MAG: DUF448 domain-containing protein [Myxococcota bacterium]